MNQQSMQMEEQSMQMEKITEQIIVSRGDFLDNYLKYYNALEISSSTKLFNCNMSGDKINTLYNEY